VAEGPKHRACAHYCAVACAALLQLQAGQALVMAMIELRVGGLGRPTCVILASREWNVGEVKDRIEETVGVPKKEQFLLVGTMELRDVDVIGQVIRSDAKSMDVMLVRRWPEQAEWLSKVEEDCYWLSRAPAELRADRDVVLAAVRQDGFLLRYAAEELRRDRGFVLAAVRLDGRALGATTPELRADREIAIAACRCNGQALDFVAPQLQADREVVLAAVRHSGTALRYAPLGVRADRTVVLTAVRQDRSALSFAAPALRADREFTRSAWVQGGTIASLHEVQAADQAGSEQQQRTQAVKKKLSLAHQNIVDRLASGKPRRDIRTPMREVAMRDMSPPPKQVEHGKLGGRAERGHIHGKGGHWDAGEGQNSAPQHHMVPTDLRTMPGQRGGFAGRPKTAKGGYPSAARGAGKGGPPKSPGGGYNTTPPAVADPQRQAQTVGTVAAPIDPYDEEQGTEVSQCADGMRVFVKGPLTGTGNVDRDIELNGKAGEVVEVNNDGDAKIDFGSLGKHWVVKESFGQLAEGWRPTEA